jgi:hypothetical protein|eukprot:COSAG06_NODE_6521_length_2896_cov_87.289954_3_plen_120_part_00
MRDFVVCCHAGFVDNTPIVDLNYAEECSNCADMPVAIMPNCGDLAEEDLAGGPGMEGTGPGSSSTAMDVDAAADVEGEQEGGDASHVRGRGDSIVMMQLDRRLPLEHFESLGTVLAYYY